MAICFIPSTPLTKLAIVVALTISFFNSAVAEMTGSGWEHEVKAYLFATSIEGDLGLQDVNVPVDVGFDDILDKLKFGGMAYYEGRKDDTISVILDVAYIDLYYKSTPINNNLITVNAKAEYSQLVVEALAGFKVVDYENSDAFSGSVKVDLIGGLRLNQLDLALGTNAALLGLTSSSARGKEVSWVDPVAGARLRFEPAENVKLNLYGDYGGFGLGADSTWQLAASGTYEFENNVQLSGGYRVLYMDYEEGSGTNYFNYDATYHGPFAGVGYRF